MELSAYVKNSMVRIMLSTIALQSVKKRSKFQSLSYIKNDAGANLYFLFVNKSHGKNNNAFISLKLFGTQEFFVIKKQTLKSFTFTIQQSKLF